MVEQRNTNGISDETEYPSIQEAFLAASVAASASYGRPVAGVLYTQTGRRFITTSFPMPMMLSIVKRDSTTKKDDPAAHRNRPLDTAHVREIADYLRNEKYYLMPSIMLNAASRLQTFVVQTPVPTKPCVFVLPAEEYLYVTDGQHRLEAIKQAMVARPELQYDSIGVTIVEEAEMDKVHQDFYDAAQVMPLAKSLLVEYDGREPLNWITREVSAVARVFTDRVEKVGNIGKTSLMLATSNQLKQSILQILVGDWSLFADQMQKQAQQTLSPAKELWRDRIVSVFDEFTDQNEQWSEVSQRPRQSGLITDVPAFREKYLHFSGAGLLVIGGVLHSIVTLEFNDDGTLSDEQRRLIRRLATLDWTKAGDLWSGHLVGPDGKITPQKNRIALIVAKVKDHLGLPLTEKEANFVENASEESPAETSLAHVT